MGEPGEPVLDVTLQAGDTLYLPRGWLHEAKTSETDSLHLTMGVNVYTWMDAFRAALDSCARRGARTRATCSIFSPGSCSRKTSSAGAGGSSCAPGGPSWAGS
jgi:ribosomal protein L16 Arg81 hydroxylase